MRHLWLTNRHLQARPAFWIALILLLLVSLARTLAAATVLYSLAAVALVFLVVLVWSLPKRQLAAVTSATVDPLEALSIENELRRTYLQAAGGLLLGAGLFATFLGLVDARLQFQATAAATDRQLALLQRGQVAERFAEAVEQVGNEREELRIGGIYSLEQVARDFPETYHSVIAEFLASFIRSRAAKGHLSPEQAQLLAQTTEESFSWRGPPADIQVAVTVLGRREIGYDRPGSYLRLNEVRILGGQLEYTAFSRVHFHRSDLRRSLFAHSDLSRAGMSSCLLQHSGFAFANLSNSILNFSDFSHANLSNADLSHCQLAGGSLQGANLANAKLLAADLVGTSMVGANVRGADLTGCNLMGADLTAAKGLTSGQLASACVYPSTVLDPVLTRPSTLNPGCHPKDLWQEIRVSFENLHPNLRPRASGG